jgi:hypothetical protein
MKKFEIKCLLRSQLLLIVIFHFPMAKSGKAENFCASPLKKDLSNETTFSLIHLVGYKVPGTFNLCVQKGRVTHNYSCIPKGLTRLAFHLVEKGFFRLGILFEKFLSLPRRGQNLGIAVRFLPEQKLQLAWSNRTSFSLLQVETSISSTRNT